MSGETQAREKFEGHTPGPWHVEQPQINMLYIVPDSQPDIYIAQIWSDDSEHDTPPTEENWAVARLMAAAPEMAGRIKELGRELAEAHEILDSAFMDNAKDSTCAKCRDHSVGYRAARLVEEAELKNATLREGLRKLLEVVPRSYYGWKIETQEELTPVIEEAEALLSGAKGGEQMGRALEYPDPEATPPHSQFTSGMSGYLRVPPPTGPEATKETQDNPKHDHICVDCGGTISRCGGTNCWGKWFVCIGCQAKRECAPSTTTAKDLFTKLRVAEKFIESVREHFEDPENTRCVDCTKALIEYDVLNAKPLEEIRNELRKHQQ